MLKIKNIRFKCAFLLALFERLKSAPITMPESFIGTTGVFKVDISSNDVSNQKHNCYFIYWVFLVYRVLAGYYVKL